MRTINETTIRTYTDYLRTEEKSPNTILKYCRDIRAFAAWQGAHGGKAINKDTVICYKQQLGRRYLPGSANSMLTALNGFLQYQGWGECRVRTLKTQPNHIYAKEKALTRDEYTRLIRAAQESGKQRLALLMETIASTGIRVSELSAVTVEAAKTGWADVTCKGKNRRVCLVPQLRSMLTDYCRQCSIQSGPVFVTRTGKPLDRSNIWAEMKKLAQKAGVASEKIFPHNLRHFFACMHYKEHKNISHLADILGHSSINTTRIYTATTEEEHVRMLEQLGLVIGELPEENRGKTGWKKPKRKKKKKMKMKMSHGSVQTGHLLPGS